MSTAKKKEVCSISAQNSFTLFFSRSWLILYLVCLRHLLSCVILWDQIRGHKSSQCSERLKKTSGEQVFKDYFWTDLSFLGCSLVWISINWQNDRVSLNYHTVRYESCFNRKCTCNLLRHMSVIHHTVKLPISLSESYMHTCSQRFRYTYDGHKLLWVMMGLLYLYCSLLFLLWCKPLDRHLPSLLLPK